MKKMLFALATLSLVAGSAEAEPEIRSFGELVDRTQKHITQIDTLQQKAGAAFFLVAPRCLRNWESYKAEYERLHSVLKEITLPELASIASYHSAVAGFDTDTGDLRHEDVCGHRGQRLVEIIPAKIEATRKLAAQLGAALQKVEQLNARAWNTFVNGALEKDFHSNFSCLFQYQYRDVALFTFFRNHYPRGERAPAPALYQLRTDLHRFSHWSRVEEEQLIYKLARLNSLRLRCALK